MKTKWIGFVSGGVFLLGASVLTAQEPLVVPPPPGAEEGMVTVMGGPGGPVGAKVEILGFGEMHPGKVVTGAPYSAVAVTETTQTLADGNTIDRKVQSNVYRDSQGRTRRENTITGFGPLAASGQTHTFVMIHDPVASTTYVLHPDEKIADKLPFPGAGGKDGGHLHQKFLVHEQADIANGTLKTDELGTETVSGVSAQGTRYTHTIAAGQIGNAKPIVVTSEQWYSPDLQLVVKSTRSDPRFGTTTYTLTNLQRQEPAAGLFSVPTDYTVQQGGPGHNLIYRTFGAHGSPNEALPAPPQE